MSIGLLTLAALMLGTSLLFYALPRLDNWQRVFGVLLISLSFTAGSIPELAIIGYYARVVLAAILLIICFRTPLRIKPKAPARRVLVALWLCFVVALVSTVWSFDPVGTAAYSAFFGLLLANLHGLLTRRWADTELVWSDLRVAFWFLTAFVTVGLAAAFIGFDFAIGYAERARGLFANANTLGNISMIVTVLGWALSTHYRSWPYLVWTIPLALAVVASGSRTALIALIVGALWLLSISPLRIRIVTIWALGVGICTFLLLGSFRLVRPLQVGDGVLARFAFADDTVTLSGRLALWEAALREGVDSFIGIGFGAAPIFMESDPLLSMLRANSIHSSYLQWFLETGFIGAIPMLWLTIACLALLFVRVVPTTSRALSAVVLSGFIAQFAESMIFGLGQVYPWLYWVIVIGAAVVSDPARKGPEANYGGKVGAGALSNRHAF